MTDKQIEIAAREYCRLIGVDPDEVTSLTPRGVAPHPIFPAKARWMHYVEKIKDHYLLTVAVEKAKEQA